MIRSNTFNTKSKHIKHINHRNNNTSNNISTMNRRLKSLLDVSRINHKTQILKQQSLKDAHIYCKLNSLSGPLTGPLIEMYIREKYNMKKNDATSCTGDAFHNQKNLEIKVSIGGLVNNKFNYVQIRMNHDCEYLFTAYYVDYCNVEELGELFVFKMKKEDVQDVILHHGGYAHGTIKKLGPITSQDLEDKTNKKEYCLRPKYGDKCWNSLIPFRIDESFI